MLSQNLYTMADMYNTTRVVVFLFTVLGSVLSFPITKTEDPYYQESPDYETYDKAQDYAHQRNDTIQRLLFSEEHQQLRKALTLALELLDREDEILNGRVDTPAHVLSETEASAVTAMPFYVEHVLSLLNGEANKQRRRKHRKRSRPSRPFDSIGHQGGGLDGLSRNGQQRGPEFDFESFLPYLIEAMKRRNSNADNA